MTLRNQRGVTLTELMVVLAIVMITTAIAVPMYIVNLPSLRLKSAAQDLLVDLRLARSWAVKNNNFYLLCFSSPTTYELAIQTGGPTTCATTDKSVNLATQYYGVEIAAGSIGSPCPDATVTDPVGFPGSTARFNKRGASVDGANNVLLTAVVYLTNTKDSKDDSYCVQVEGTTGRPRLWKWDGSQGIWK